MLTTYRDRSVIQYASPDFDNTEPVDAAVFVTEFTIKVFLLKIILLHFKFRVPSVTLRYVTKC